MKLALGTVQFGLDYGISNTRGRVPVDEVRTILKAAASGDIDTLDTAAAYGRSEEALGETLDSDHRFRLVSKYSAVDEDKNPKSILVGSLARLRQSRIYGYLFHNYHSFRDRLHLVDTLQAAREEGLVERIGFSVYHPDELKAILDGNLPIQLVQIPFNVFDQRFRPLLPELRALAIEVHSRSAFLQGLVFRNPEELASFFDPIKPGLRALKALSRETQIPVATLCLNYALLQQEIDRVVIGVSKLSELEDDIAATRAVSEVEECAEQLDALACEIEEVINPAKWGS